MGILGIQNARASRKIGVAKAAGRISGAVQVTGFLFTSSTTSSSSTSTTGQETGVGGDDKSTTQHKKQQAEGTIRGGGEDHDFHHTINFIKQQQ